MLKRPLFCASVAAIVTAVITSALTGFNLLIPGCVLVLAALFILPLKDEVRKSAMLIIGLSFIMAVCCSLYYALMYEPILKYGGFRVQAQCTAISDYNGEYVDFICNSVSENGNTRKERFKVRVYNLPQTDIVPSAEVSLDMVFADSDRFDRFASGGVHATAYSENIIIDSAYNRNSIRYIYYKFRNAITNRIDFGDREVSAFMRGMLLGDTDGIPDRFTNMFRTIGMSHVLSVSGMHLLFAVLFFDFILSIIGLGYKPRSAVSIVAIILFTVMSGFAVSCIRSAIMLIIYFTARLNDKLPDGLTSLSVSAVLILLATPYNIGNVSFLLSVSATFGLIVLTPFLNGFLLPKVKGDAANIIIRAITGAVVMSVSANIACIPIFVFIFKEVNIIAPFSNLLLTVPITALFYLGFTFMIVGSVQFPGEFMALSVRRLYDFIEKCVEFCYGIRNITINAGYRYFYLFFVLFCCFMIGIYLLSKRSEKLRIYPYIIGFAVFSVILVTVNSFVNNGIMMLTYADVGHGCCTVASKDERAVVIDCGGDTAYGILGALKRQSVKQINMLAITHADTDHINHIKKIVSTYKTKLIVYPYFTKSDELDDILKFAAESGTEIRCIKSDEEYQPINGVKVKAYVSLATNYMNNSNVCALYKLSYNGCTALFPGDMGLRQEYTYLKYGKELDCDILLAAHHGSATSSLPMMLELCSPEYTVISATSEDYKEKNALSRIADISTVLRTDLLSDITFKIDKKGYTLK